MYPLFCFSITKIKQYLLEPGSSLLEYDVEHEYINHFLFHAQFKFLVKISYKQKNTN